MMYIILLLIVIVIIVIYNKHITEYFKTNITYHFNYLNDPFKQITKQDNINDKLFFKKYEPSDKNNLIFKENTTKNPINNIDNGSDIRNCITTSNNNNNIIDDNNYYKLYSDALFTFKPAKKILNDNINIDQTINTNIKNYIHDGITSIYDEDNNTHSYNKTNVNNKTIKELYDNITNDGRLELQQNLDDVECDDTRDDYDINKKYGTTRFDTYSVP